MTTASPWWAFWRQPAPVVIARPETSPTSAPVKRSPMRIGTEFLIRARAGKPQPIKLEPFKPTEPGPGVLPKSHKIAMDSGFVGESTGWATGAISGIFAEGQSFVGYPELSLLAQRPEYRVITETIATEMTRKWIKLTATGEDKTDKIKAINADMDRLGARKAFHEVAEHDGFFGRGHIFTDLGTTDDKDELQTSIGDGSDKASVNKVGLGALKSIRTIEPVWSYPASYNSTDPLKPNWYKPDAWYVMGRTVHHTRILTFVGREVPDLLKPAYQFGGLPMTQMAKPYVTNWLEIRQGVTDIVLAFSTFVLKTNMSSVMSGGNGDDVLSRVDVFNAIRTNRGTLAIDKDTEDFTNIAAPLGSLDKLQAQAQEHMAAVSKIPLVKLTGISPSGLNASSDGELRCFEDAIHAYQEIFFRPNLTKLINLIQLSLFGAVDPEIGFIFVPLYELSEKEKAEVRKIEADTDSVYVDMGAVSPPEVRARVAADPDSPYSGLDVADLPDLEEEEAEGLVVKGEGGETGPDGESTEKEAA